MSFNLYIGGSRVVTLPSGKKETEHLEVQETMRLLRQTPQKVTLEIMSSGKDFEGMLQDYFAWLKTVESHTIFSPRDILHDSLLGLTPDLVLTKRDYLRMLDLGTEIERIVWGHQEESAKLFENKEKKVEGIVWVSDYELSRFRTLAKVRDLQDRGFSLEMYYM